MSMLLPRLPAAAAAGLLDASGGAPAPAISNRAQLFAPVGGRRITEDQLQTLREQVLTLAREHNFPGVSSDSERIAFDRAAADLLCEALEITWAEAGSRDIWTWTACVLLPDVTFWRFGSRNRERWIASDLTRHTWSRLWWQAVVFGKGSPLIRSLSESDLNQLLERRTIGGDPRLVKALASAVLDVSTAESIVRRSLIRDATARLRRRLAFIDARALDETQIREFCHEIVNDSARVLTSS